VITARSLTVTPNTGQSKIYGANDPTPFTYTHGQLYNNDTDSVFSGALSRVAGENVGTYAYTLGNLSAGNNYTLSLTPGVSFAIAPRTVTVTPNTGQSKIYGANDPTPFTYTHGQLYNNDTDSVFTGALGRLAGENVGTYAYTPGNLSAGNNYTISLTPGYSFAITARSLTITPNDNQSKVYGAADPTFTYTHGQLYNNDTNSVFTGALGRAAGDDVGTYAYTLGNLSAGNNYTLSLTAGKTFAITQKPATWTTNANSRYWGLPDPNPLTTGSGSGFLAGDGVSATYSRASGTDVGTYHITATLSATRTDALNNYTITNTGNTFTINQDTTSLTLNSPTSNTDFGCANQYTATLLDTVTHLGISGVTLRLTIGSQSTTAVTQGDGGATFTLTLNQMITPPATSIVVPESVAIVSGLSNMFASPNSLPSQQFTINADPNVGPAYNAATLYTGSRFFWTTGPSSSTATLTLTATIKDTGVCGNDSAILGDVTKAKVTFMISTNDGGTWSAVSSGQNLPVGLVTPGDNTVGTASVISQYNIGNNNSGTILVKVIVGGEYTFNTDAYDVPVTIAKPGVGSELIAAGGLANDGISGLLNGTSPLSGNFMANGFLGSGDGLASGGVKADAVDFSGTVVYSKSGTNPQGQLTLAIHSFNKPDGSTDGKPHAYYVKSNSIANLAFTGTVGGPRTATFSAKTNVYDMTGAKVGIDGGGTMQFTFSQPGAQYQVTSGGQTVTLTCPKTLPDGSNNPVGCASVIVYKSTGGVWFSSAWGPVTSGAVPQTVQKLMLPGGGMQIS
jgi:MBG domain (YGX type)